MIKILLGIIMLFLVCLILPVYSAAQSPNYSTTTTTITSTASSTSQTCGYQGFNATFIQSENIGQGIPIAYPSLIFVVNIYYNDAAVPLQIQTYSFPVLNTGKVDSTFLTAIYEQYSTNQPFSEVWAASPFQVHAGDTNQMFTFEPNIYIPAGTFFAIAFADTNSSVLTNTKVINSTATFYSYSSGTTYALSPFPTTGIIFYVAPIQGNYNCGYQPAHLYDNELLVTSKLPSFFSVNQLSPLYPAYYPCIIVPCTSVSSSTTTYTIAPPVPVILINQLQFYQNTVYTYNSVTNTVGADNAVNEIMATIGNPLFLTPLLLLFVPMLVVIGTGNRWLAMAVFGISFVLSLILNYIPIWGVVLIGLTMAVWFLRGGGSSSER